VLSIVIPTLNAKSGLRSCLDMATQSPIKYELVVADGGSNDGTVELAQNMGCKLVATPKGRGLQLKAGATAAEGDWLLFLHADTQLEASWGEALISFIAQPNAKQKAAYFTFALNDRSADARRVENMVAWRCENMALPYGDQGLLISRELYNAVGGYEAVPLMEDVGLVRRIGPERLVCLPIKAITSAVRFQKGGYILRPLRNIFCLGLYLLGVSPRTIVKFYQ